MEIAWMSLCGGIAVCSSLVILTLATSLKAERETAIRERSELLDRIMSRDINEFRSVATQEDSPSKIVRQFRNQDLEDYMK